MRKMYLKKTDWLYRGLCPILWTSVSLCYKIDLNNDPISKNRPTLDSIATKRQHQINFFGHYSHIKYAKNLYIKPDWLYRGLCPILWTSVLLCHKIDFNTGPISKNRPTLDSESTDRPH